MRASCFSRRRRRLKRIFDRVDAFLKDDLLRGMVELLTGKPAPMRKRPVAASAVDAAVPEQEGKKLLALAPEIVSSRLAGPHKIPHRLMSRIGRPDPCQFAGSVQTHQRNRIPTVRLDPLACSLRDQRRDHQAIVAERLHLAIKPVSRRPGFEADMQQVVPGRQSLDGPLDGSGLFSTSPRNRTSPCRRPCAIATACSFLATKTSLCFPMVRIGLSDFSARIRPFAARRPRRSAAPPGRRPS